MPVRTSYVGTQIAGDVLTAANFSKLPGGWIGYAEVTANQTGITTVTDLTGLTVTVTAGTARRLKITGRCLADSSVITDRIILSIKESATTFGQGYGHPPAANEQETITAEATVTPSAGTHTYKLTLERNGTGTVRMIAAATVPAFIVVEDIGPAA